MERQQLKPGTWLDRSYVSEFVYGGIDGAITTFAVVAGAAGAKLGMEVVLVLGFANLLADGFSMSVGNFFSTRATLDHYNRQERKEHWEVEHLPDQEREEIRQIYRNKGFEGDLLEQVVKVITSNREVWVNTMMKEELELSREQKPAIRTALVTFLSFILVGLIPLLAYVLALFLRLPEHLLFPISCVATSAGLSVVGYFKSVVTGRSVWRGITETVLLGGAAAAVAYLVGAVLEQIIVS